MVVVAIAVVNDINDITRWRIAIKRLLEERFTST